MSTSTSSTDRISAGHLIVKTLEAHGVERLYSVPGLSLIHI